MSILGLAALAAAGGAKASIANYPFSVDSVRNGENFQLVARNDGLAPITTLVNFSGNNAATDHNWPMLVVVPARTSLVLANVFAAAPGMSYRFNTTYTKVFGDANAFNDARVPYRLPYPDGMAFSIGQAFGGPLTTHRDLRTQYAVDFNMPEGTPVAAAREGTVVDIVTGNTQGGIDPYFLDKANSVSILHKDGTIATYAHLSPRTTPVFVGQQVNAGDVIAWSGNTGYSSGPHLHFCVSKPVPQPQGGLADQCQPVLFATGAPATVFPPQFHLLALASSTAPAVIRNIDVPVQVPQPVSLPDLPRIIPATVTVPNPADLMPYLQRLRHMPWWGWALSVLATALALSRLFAMFSRKSYQSRKEPSWQDKVYNPREFREPK